MPQEPLLIAVAALSAAVMGFSKTGLPGASILSVALMAAAFREDVGLSVGAMLPLLIVGDVLAVIRFRRHAAWDRLVALFPAVLAGMIPAYFVLTRLTGKQLQPLLGGLILGLVALEFLRLRLKWNALADRWWFAGGSGFLAGFGTVVGNAGGPPMALYLLSRGLPKERFVGTCAWFFFFINLSKIVPFWRQGMITRGTLAFSLSIVPAVLVGVGLGVWLLPRVSQKTFNALVLLLAALAAVWLLVA